MPARLVFRSELPEPTGGEAAFLADLGFPCHLDCSPCRRDRPPSPREYLTVQRSLTSAIAENSGRLLRVVFFGGDVFTRPLEFAALLRAAQQACREAGVVLDAAAFSDGAAWDASTVALFHALGVHHYQVVLDGPAGIHDLVRPSRGGGGSFERILDSVKRHRGLARVVLRVDPAIGQEALSELIEDVDERGLFASPNPVVVLVSAPTNYRCEARELLALIQLSRGAGGVEAAAPA